MKKGIFLILPVILIAAALSGCCGGAVSGGYLVPTPTPSGMTPRPSGMTPEPSPTIGPRIDPQTLIDLKTAESLVGNALTPMEVTKDKPNKDESVGMTYFLYNAPATGGRFLQISLYQRTKTFNTDPRIIFNSFQKKADKATAEPVIAAVEGIGDAAFIGEPGIHIMYQGYYIVISVGDPTDAKNQEILKNAGTAAVANLKAALGIK